MRKFLTAICFFLLSGCASPAYHFQATSLIHEGKGNTVKIVSPDNSVAMGKLKPFFEDILKNNGFKVVSADKNAKYGFVYGINRRAWQSMKTIPVVEPTGIRSIHTNSYGNVTGNSYGNYSGTSAIRPGMVYHNGNYNGTYNASYSGTSDTSVEYNYGVTGYHNAIVNNFLMSFTVLMMDFKTKQLVFESQLVTSEYNDDSDFVEYAKDIYSKYPFFMDKKMDLVCQKVGMIGQCSVPENFGF